MSMMEEMVLRGRKDFLRRVSRRAKRERCGRRKALRENEEEEEGDEFVVVVVVFVVGGDEEEEAKWGGERRTSVMAGNERGLYLEYKKRKHKDFVI